MHTCYTLYAHTTHYIHTRHTIHTRYTLYAHTPHHTHATFYIHTRYTLYTHIVRIWSFINLDREQRCLSRKWTRLPSSTQPPIKEFIVLEDTFVRILCYVLGSNSAVYYHVGSDTAHTTHTRMIHGSGRNYGSVDSPVILDVQKFLHELMAYNGHACERKAAEYLETLDITKYVMASEH